jgi:hypothetical protein
MKDVSRIAIIGMNIGMMQKTHQNRLNAKSRRASAYAAIEFTARLASVKMSAPPKVTSIARENSGSWMMST